MVGLIDIISIFLDADVIIDKDTQHPIIWKIRIESFNPDSLQNAPVSIYTITLHKIFVSRLKIKKTQHSVELQLL
jgi:hypothetical protein